MSSIVTERGILHYESIGRGRPVILLHGWINSWDVWRDSMVTLAKTRRYRVYALDFWGFGDSATGAEDSDATFQVSSYVEMVHQFMMTLGIQKAPIIGHSMGGTVALSMALEHPDRVARTAIVGAPVVGSSLNPFLRLSGYNLIAQLVWRYPFIRDNIMKILLAGDSREVKAMIFRDVQRTTMESFFRSIGDLRATDLRSRLDTLESPVLGMYGVKDNIVSPSNAGLLTSGSRIAKIVMMNHSRHFPMIDEPDRFVAALQEFLNDDGAGD